MRRGRADRLGLPVTLLRGAAWTIIALVLATIVGIAAFGFFMLRSDVHMLQRLSLERIDWQTSKIEAEHAHFEAIVARYALGAPDVTAEEVGEAFLRLESRFNALIASSGYPRIVEHDRDGTLRVLAEMIERDRLVLLDLAAADPSAIRAIHFETRNLADNLSLLSEAVIWAEERLHHEIRRDLRESSEMTLSLSLLSLVLAVAFVIALNVELKRYRRLSSENMELAEAAQSASRTKSRFLSMVSHELRTPMNGVLGLIALVRQSGMSDAQNRLLERAEASGREMIDQLVDIMDFAELDAKDTRVETCPFDPSELAVSVENLFGPAAHREGLEFTVQSACPPGQRLSGDYARIRQIVTHLTSFVLHRIALESMQVTVASVPGMLTLVLDYLETAPGHAGWRSEAVLGKANGAWGSIESDALGPAIARGLLGQLDGNLELERPGANSARLIVTVPVTVLRHADPLVRIEVCSSTMRTVCGKLLTRLGARQWDAAAAQERVDAILIEPGAEAERDRAVVSELRERHPGARVVALGTSREAEIYDATLSVPPRLSDLERVLDSGDEAG